MTTRGSVRSTPLNAPRKFNQACRNDDARPVRPFQLPLFALYDEHARQIERLLMRMKYDDALERRRGWYIDWRVEYLYLESGCPHYRIFHHGQLMGVVRIQANAERGLSYRDRELAAYLAWMGFNSNNTRLVCAGAKTALDARTDELPYLFWSDAVSAKKHRKVRKSSPPETPAQTCATLIS